MSRSRSLTRRGAVLSRVLAAAIGGYLVTNLAVLAVPLLAASLGADVPQALLASSMTSFLFYAAIIMAVFHARSAVWAWAWLAGAAAPLAIIIFLLWPGVGA